MNKVVIGHYYYVTIMDENVNWMKLTCMLSMFSLNLEATFTSRFLTTSLKVHTIENLYLSLIYTNLYANASNNTPSYTHVHSHVGGRWVHYPGQHSPFEVLRPMKGSLEPLRVDIVWRISYSVNFFMSPYHNKIGVLENNPL